jgi:hypothetical protein
MATKETENHQPSRTASVRDPGTTGDEPPSLSTKAVAAIVSYSKTATELAVLPAK